MQRTVIIGGGLAGFEAARALRGQGFVGEIVMLAAESEPPYDRPPLSKDVLAWREVTLHFDLSALADVDVRLGTPATGLEPGSVLTDGGCHRVRHSCHRCRGNSDLAAGHDHPAHAR